MNGNSLSLVPVTWAISANLTFIKKLQPKFLMNDLFFVVTDKEFGSFPHVRSVYFLPNSPVEVAFLRYETACP
jgi:hypothetical protein